MDSARTGRPVLEVSDLVNAENTISLADRVAAIADDFDPFAIDEPGSGRVRVYFGSISDRDAAMSAVTAEYGAAVCVSARYVPADDWATRSQSDLRAVRIGRVIVAPPWDLPTSAVSDDTVVVRLRPALGFGSGHHPTTRLTLLGLQQVALAGQDVLDLGTGSGLVAVAAVKLGARRAIGIDRDADALRSAQQCVTENHVSGQVKLLKGDLPTMPNKAPIVAANLTGATLARLAQAILARVTPGGHLILSGILASEADTVLEAYATGTELVWQAFEEEWVGIMVRIEIQA